MQQGDINIIRICEVIDVDDNTDGNRIKVRLLPDDGTTPVEDLPYAIPFLPQMVHVRPKLHEAVLVLNSVANKGYSQRYYIGPLVSQINHIYNESYTESTKGFTTSAQQKDPAVTQNTNDTLGALPKNDDVAIMGRKLSDVILSDNDLRIRCGVKKVEDGNPNTFSFNPTDSSFIKLKYYNDGLSGVDNCNSTATIVADKINLISNQGDNGFFKSFTQNREEMINDSDMKTIITLAHKLPYGDLLVEFLEKFRKEFLYHTHPFSMLPPCRPDSFQELAKFDLKTLLSDSVRIN